MPRTKTIPDEDVLAAVIRVFVAIGPSSFTLAAVAAETGLAPATLVQRFGNKRGLLIAAWRWSNDQLAARLSGISGKAATQDRLIDELTELAEGFGDPASMADQLVILAEDLRDPELAAIAAERTEMIRAFARRCLPRTKLRPASAGRLIEAMWHGSIIQAAIDRNQDVPKQVRRNLTAIVAMLTG